MATNPTNAADHLAVEMHGHVEAVIFELNLKLSIPRSNQTKKNKNRQQNCHRQPHLPY